MTNDDDHIFTSDALSPGTIATLAFGFLIGSAIGIGFLVMWAVDVVGRGL